MATSNLKSEKAATATKMLRPGLHPVQMKALTILGDREASPTEIAVELGLTKAKAGYVSHHVKRLRDRGLVKLVRTLPVRGAREHFYRAAMPFVVTGEEAEQLTFEERLVLSCWTISCINRDFLRAVESKSIDERIDRHLTRSPLQLDQKGFDDLISEQDAFYHRTRYIRAESTERRSATREPALPVLSIVAGFPMPRETVDSD